MLYNLKNKKVIITGGLGFLGKQIINAFYQEGSKVIVLDNKKKLLQKNLNIIHATYVMRKV